MQFVMCFFPICLNYIMPNAAFKATVIHLSILLYFYYTQYMLPKYTKNRELWNFLNHLRVGSNESLKRTGSSELFVRESDITPD